jgi:hypothetical protein
MLFSVCRVGFSYAITADELLARIDANQDAYSQKFSAKMIISKKTRSLTKVFNGVGVKAGEKAYMEFTNPEDRGVKYLKLGDELYIYLPQAQDSMKIAGHMLRQGMMGSDISYEDMLSKDSLQKSYEAAIVKETNFMGRPCLLLRLSAKKPDVTYHVREAIVDTQWNVVLQSRLYAKSGRLLKEMLFEDVRTIGGKNVAMRMVIHDRTRKDSKTEIHFLSLEINMPVDPSLFTLSNLSR